MGIFDENAAVLRDMESRGKDLSYEREVDFSYVFPSADTAEAFIRACLKQDLKAVDTTNDLMDHFDVTVSIVMIPSCDNITAAEERLGSLAARFEGRADGWGFFSN